MSDLHKDLDREARRVNAEPDALSAVRRRADRSRRVRAVTSGVLALVIGGAGLGLAYAAFRTPSSNRPAAGPTSTPEPGPTPTSDDATPPPVRIVIEERTGFVDTLPYAFAWIEARGRGAHHGGYDVGDANRSGFEGIGDPVAPTSTGEPIPITTIYCDPEYAAEALRMRELLFPGAQVARERTDEGVHVAYDPQPLLTVVLGRDFAERHMQAMRAFVFVADFGLARMAESPRATDYVIEEVARAYREGPSLSMYEYAARRPYDVGLAHSEGVPKNGEPGMEFSLTYYGDTKHDFHYEVVRVDSLDGELKIVEASLTTVGSS